MATARSAYPPTHTHPSQTRILTPSAAASHLSTYLSLTPSSAHLHPDAQLSTHAINFSATSGPSGGLALHHLRRVEAGLKGENLVRETQEELEAQFGEAVTGIEKSDDRRLDGLIAGTEGGRKRERVEEWVDGDVTAAGALQGEDDAQDAVEYAQEQEMLEGEIGERDPAASSAGAGKVDVKDRKAAKKQRRNQEKKEKVKEMAKKKSAD